MDRPGSGGGAAVTAGTTQSNSISSPHQTDNALKKSNLNVSYQLTTPDKIGDLIILI